MYLSKNNFNFYNFHVVDMDFISFNFYMLESKIILKVKKKFNPRTTLYDAVIEVFMSYLNTLSSTNTKGIIMVPEVQKKKVNIIMNLIQHIYCNGYDLVGFLNDNKSTLFQLDSQDSPLSSGIPIKILVTHLSSRASYIKSETETSILSPMRNSCTSTEFNVNNKEITVFVKIISNIIQIKTGFHQFSVNNDDRYLKLLENVLDYHTQNLIFTKKESSILMKQQWNIKLHSNPNCAITDTINVTLSDTCNSVKSSKCPYVIYKFMMEKELAKETTLKKNFFELLMSSHKNYHLPARMEPISFPNKLYNHIIDIYEQQNLSVNSSF